MRKLLIFALLLVALPASAGISFISGTTGQTVCAAGSASCTSSSWDTTGATAYVLIAISNDFDVNQTTITDFSSNTYTPLTWFGSGFSSVQMFYVCGPATSTTETFTATDSSGTSRSVGFIAFALTGTLTTACFDTGTNNGAASGSGSVSTIQPGTTGTLAGVGEIVITGVCTGAAGAGATMTIDSGMSIYAFTTSGYGGSTAYFVASSTTALNPTWTDTGPQQLSATIGAFKPASNPRRHQGYVVSSQ